MMISNPQVTTQKRGNAPVCPDVAPMKAALSQGRRGSTLSAALLSLGLAVSAMAAPSAAVEQALAAVRSVGPKGQGTAAAQSAWKQLAAQPPSALPEILAGMDGANDYALNWLRSAADTIAAKPGATLPVDALLRFVGETTHHPRARRFAFELVQRADPARADQLKTTFLNDPSNELRRDAVAGVLAQAAQLVEKGAKTEAIPSYEKALAHARDVDQIEGAAKALTELGQKVDLQKTFGWVTRWQLVAPFNNADGVGFNQAFEPERNADPAREYEVQGGKGSWKPFTSKSDYGLINFNEPYTQLKGVAGYAQSDFYSPTDRTVEIRIGCKNAWKLWVNGEFLFGRDEYHRGAEIDQYRIQTQLKAGKNTFLVKCLQNEQKEDWTVEWEFQLRVTDAQGTPIVSTQ